MKVYKAGLPNYVVKGLLTKTLRAKNNMFGSVPRILITPGEPAGIGPDIVVQLAQQEWDAELVVVADPTVLQARAKQLSLSLELLPAEITSPVTKHQAGTLKIIPVATSAPVTPGVLDSKNARYVLECLEIATDLCLQNKASALVTGPVQKSIINAANIPFSGHTEFLAERCQSKDAIMLFVVDDLKVALATTHLPLAKVSAAITKEKLISLIQQLHDELQNKFGIADPRILVCGLNPHAGEEGLLGSEEIEVITPALEQLRADHINVIGPLPADTIFTAKHRENADVILAMYHDQALPVVKYLGFDRAVNVTLGLRIIRTSVDHGTALDVAGSGNADAGSLAAAVRLAIQLSTKKV
jgi:4-hydroxythreonine-4-phosphate dehydrogenase